MKRLLDIAAWSVVIAAMLTVASIIGYALYRMFIDISRTELIALGTIGGLLVSLVAIWALVEWSFKRATNSLK